MSCEARPDPLLAQPLAHAERAREWLEELARIGMHFARQMDAHAAAAMADICEKKEGNPARAFATLSRAIRLTLAMEARIDAMILALRKGTLPRGWAMGVGAPAAVERAPQAPQREVLCPAREDLVDRESFGRYEISLFDTRVVGFHGAPKLERNSSRLAPHPPEEKGGEPARSANDHEVVQGAATPTTAGGMNAGAKSHRFRRSPPPPPLRGPPPP